MSITLTYGSTVVTLGDKERAPFSRKLAASQSAFKTDANTMVVYDHGSNSNKFDVNLENLTTTEKNNLESFWINTVNKQAKAWDFKDSLDRTYKVFFGSEELDPIMQEGGLRWNITISLLVDDRLNQYILYMPLESNLNLVAGTGAATFTRSTIGTYIEDGVLKTAAINAPRFEDNGLLMEGASTNVLLYSEDLSAGVWTGTAVAPVTDGTLGPDGVTQAWKVEDDDNAATEFLNNNVIAGGYAVGDYSGSYVLKSGSSSLCRVNFQIYGSTTCAVNSYINLVTGASSNSAVKTEKLANGWWRILMSVANTDAGNTFARVLIYPATGAASPDVTAMGYVYCTNAQIEALPFVTSYIKTTSTSVTRATDFCTIQFSGNHPNIQHGNPFSYIVDADSHNVNAPVRTIIAVGLSEAGINDYSFLWVNNATSDVAYYRSSSGVDFSGEDLDVLTRYCVTVSDYEIVSTYLNGVLSASSTESLFDDTGIDAANIGIGCYATGGSVMYGHIKNLRIYNVALHAAEIRYA